MAVPVTSFPLMLLVRFTGILVATLVLTWVVHFRGGMALISDNKDLIFNMLYVEAFEVGTSNSNGLQTNGLYRRLFQTIDCKAACGERCKAASLNDRCLRACGTCCSRCNCVPPGTSGNKELCPCYANMKTHGNRPKCP